MTDTTTKAITSLHVFGANFTLKMLPTLFFLLFVPLFCALGTWQYHRAQHKAMILRELAERQQLPPISIDKIVSPKEQEFYKVTTQGVLLGAQSLLIQNKFHEHQLGYVVLTPLQLYDGSKVLLNRGWIARDKTQQIERESKTIDVQGIVYVPEEKIFQLGDAQTTVDGFTVLQNNSWHEIHHAAPNTGLKGFEIIANPQSAHGFTQIFTPTLMPPSKHMAYSVQWFAMALTVMVIFLWSSLRKNDL